METAQEIASGKDPPLSPVLRGVQRGLKSLYATDELPSSSRIDALMQRLRQKEQSHF